MQLLKKILLVILLLVFLIGLGGYFYLNHLKPSYEGSLSLDGLAKETTVYFDDYGIPHIEAESQEDAMTALGYIHAQDRLWQMELLRRIAPGRLSEIFGKDMLPNDRFFASLGIEEASVSSLEKLDKKGPIFNLANAYLYGVNQFIKNGPTPIEFTLIGVDKEPYDLVDVYNILGYMSFSFAMAQKTDPLLSVLHEKLGATYLADLAIHVNPNTTLIKNYKNETESLVELANAADAVMASMPIPPFIGSNSWVISGEKTRSGKVLFANDPHIQYSQPSVWYEAHISCPDYEMYGYHIAGVPFPLLGHNRQYAYGLTMLENDDIDFYLEELHPENKNLYKTPQGFIEFESSNKTIHVKDAEPEIITIRSTRHGPIMNDVIEAITTENPIAMSWIYTAFNVEILDALFTISRATSMADVRKGASQIHAPGLNVMYGDSEGNVAWWAAGKLYKHRDHVNTKLVLNGSSDADDPVAYLDFNENPMAENPPWKYVYSANNQPDSIAGMLYPGYYLPEDRAKRIVELLESSDNWDQNAVESMINDVTSSVAKKNIKEFTQAMDYNSFSKKEQRAIDILQMWDGSNTIDNVAPTIYNKWIYLYLKNTFEDEMGPNIFEKMERTHLMKRVINDHLKRDSSVWWDNIETDSKETKKDILSVALKQTVAQLADQLGPEIRQWNWGKVHTLEHEHPLGTVSILKKYFNVGPFPIKGAREVLDNRGYIYNDTGLYKVFAGPSTRRVIDFSNIENSRSILPTGQSGNPLSPHFKDQAIMYNNGEFRKMKLNKEEIKAVSTKLTIQPKNE